MWSTKLFTLAVTASTLILNVSAHARVAATQAAASALTRNDVTSGSTTSCTSLESAAATISGSQVNAVVVSFNGGGDGSTFVAAGLSTTGQTGTFTPVNVTTNGNQNPSAATTSNIVVTMPAGTDCSTGNCFLAFKTTAGFGDCLAVTGSASGAAAADTTAASETTAAAATTDTTAASTTSAAGAAVTHHHHHHGTTAAGAAAQAEKAAKLKAEGKNGKRERPHARAWFMVGKDQ